MNARAPTFAAVPPVARRGLNREQAATYVGVSANTFDGMIDDGRMPKPVRIGNRRIWDVRELDLAFDALPREAEKDTWADY